jgi:membrane-associated phospholipid phosphatase
MTLVFISYLRDIDLALFHFINGFCGQSLLFDHIADRLENSQLKGLAFTGTFGVLWFQRTTAQVRQRETLILVLLAVIISLGLSRALADLVPFRIRPMFASGIGYRAPLTQSAASFENWSSFPSDNAALAFVLTTGFWLVSRWWGLLWACFSIMVVVARVYFGMLALCGGRGMSFRICRGTLGSLAMFTAIRNASSRDSRFMDIWRCGSSSKMMCASDTPKKVEN